ncbi:histone H1-beta [Apostichopus japonicus]|uniref:Histone H1-beta n=1 Tax=Stichopus japonicus TaxID=307972 RepID=A0A2G8JX95_STIJA|nr:histone H1-beta [Apostichopus japonicus]
MVTETKKATKSKPTGPTTLDLVVKAVTALNDTKGSSGVAIKKHIKASGVERSSVFVNKAIKRGVATGVLKQVTGTGASGTFKLDTAKAKKAEQEKAKKQKAVQRKRT